MTKPIKNERGYIVNAAVLGVDDVVGRKVVCPICMGPPPPPFEMWPEGWDSHAHICKGLSGDTPEERKAEYKRVLRHLFR